MSTITVTVSGRVGSGKSAICGEIEILCKALGLSVEWKGGRQEKNLTHADWTAALEMYSPTVEIIEAIDAPAPHSGEAGPLSKVRVVNEEMQYGPGAFSVVTVSRGAAADGLERKSPFSNCRFKECDLPGQCVGEGKCHHPVIDAPIGEAGGVVAEAIAFAASLEQSAAMLQEVALGMDDDYEPDSPADIQGGLEVQAQQYCKAATLLRSLAAQPQAAPSDEIETLKHDNDRLMDSVSGEAAEVDRLMQTFGKCRAALVESREQMTRIGQTGIYDRITECIDAIDAAQQANGGV